MKQKLSFKEYIYVASMLFGMFFGAGNLIFPVYMGQVAGRNMWAAVLGFLITGVGLPLQTVMDLQPFPGTIPQFPAGTGMNIPVVQLHTGEYPVPGHGGFTAGGVRIEAQRIGFAVVGGCAGGRESRSGKTHRILLYRS